MNKEATSTQLITGGLEQGKIRVSNNEEEDEEDNECSALHITMCPPYNNLVRKMYFEPHYKDNETKTHF